MSHDWGAGLGRGFGCRQLDRRRAGTRYAPGVSAVLWLGRDGLSAMLQLVVVLLRSFDRLLRRLLQAGAAGMLMYPRAL